MKNVCLLFIFTIFFIPRSIAVPYGNQLTDFLGESILHPDLHAWMVYMRSDNTVEKLQPNNDLYSIEYRDHGVALDFSLNFHLKGIRLFDSGAVYSRYDLPLPLGLQYIMGIEDLLAFNKAFQWDEFNRYEVIASFDTMSVLVYMRDDQIELVHFKATPEFVRMKEIANMLGIRFRLIPDGNCLSGNCYDSTGTMDWGEGVIKYTGEWEHGFPNGSGVYLDTFGNAYQGEFMMGSFWGNGIYQQRDHMEYSGSFVFGTRTGHGKAIYANGYRYVGGWLNDLFHGEGTYFQQKGYVYEGEFRQGKFEGEGKLTTPLGYYEGSFRNGRPHGKGEQYSSETGNTLIGTWENGKKEGEFEFVSPAGKRVTIYFKDDVQVTR